MRSIEAEGVLGRLLVFIHECGIVSVCAVFSAHSEQEESMGSKGLFGLILGVMLVLGLGSPAQAQQRWQYNYRYEHRWQQHQQQYVQPYQYYAPPTYYYTPPPVYYVPPTIQYYCVNDATGIILHEGPCR